MNIKTHNITIATILLGVASVPNTLMAQKQLESIVNKLSEGAKGVEVMYSEKRDPATKAIISQSNMITGKDKQIYMQIAGAIVAERPNSVSYSNIGNEMYNITFEENGLTTTYSLMIDKEWMFSIITKPTKPTKK